MPLDDSTQDNSFFARNQQWVAPGQHVYNTPLAGMDEARFRYWLRKNDVPFDPKAPVSDYDMRGFWRGLQAGDPHAVSTVDPNDKKLHYPDYWKTPYHETFSNESQWAMPDAPHWTDDDKLVDKSGAVLFDDRRNADAATQKTDQATPFDQWKAKRDAGINAAPIPPNVKQQMIDSEDYGEGDTINTRTPAERDLWETEERSRAGRRPGTPSTTGAPPQPGRDLPLEFGLNPDNSGLARDHLPDVQPISDRQGQTENDILNQDVREHGGLLLGTTRTDQSDANADPAMNRLQPGVDARTGDTFMSLNPDEHETQGPPRGDTEGMADGGRAHLADGGDPPDQDLPPPPPGAVPLETKAPETSETTLPPPPPGAVPLGKEQTEPVHAPGEPPKWKEPPPAAKEDATQEPFEPTNEAEYNQWLQSSPAGGVVKLPTGETWTKPKDYEAPPSGTKAFMRGAGAGVGPAAGGLAGFGAGAALGAEVGAFGGPLAWATVPAGALIGGGLGAWGGGWLGSKAQDKVVSMLPTAAQEAIGQSPAQIEAAQKAHPYAFEAGTFAPNVIAFSPLAAERAATEGASTLTRLMAHPITARAVPAAVMAAQDAVQQTVAGEPIDPGSLALAAGAGALMQRETTIGRSLINAGARPVETVFGHVPGAPQAIAGAAQGEAPTEGAPSHGEVIGMDLGKGVERATVTGSTADGDVVLTDPDGTQHIMTAADVARLRTEAPAEAPNATPPEPTAAPPAVEAPPAEGATRPPVTEGQETAPRTLDDLDQEAADERAAAQGQPPATPPEARIAHAEQELEAMAQPHPPAPEPEPPPVAEPEPPPAPVQEPEVEQTGALAQVPHGIEPPREQIAPESATPVEPTVHDELAAAPSPTENTSGFIDHVEDMAERAANPRAAIAPPAEPAQPIPYRSVRNTTEPAFIPSTGAAFPTEYGIVDARDLVTSHHDDLSPNSAYPQALQPRSRERMETEAQLSGILNGDPRDPEARFRPELLGESPDAANGSPIIGADGYVESGNARSMAIKRAYDRGLPQADEYRRYLADSGYPVEGIEQPVLVRLNRANMDMPQREQLARDLNVSPQATMSATDRAMADAQQVTPDILRGYQGGDLFSGANRPFWHGILDRIAKPHELPALTNPEGGLSPAGQTRIRSAVLAKAYGDPDIVSALTEDPDSNIKSIGNALTDAAPRWAQLRDAIAQGRVPQEYDLTAPLLEAVRLVHHARDTGRNVAEFTNQRELLGGGLSPETESMLSWMLGAPDYSRRYGREKIADTISEYADSILRPRRIGEVLPARAALVGNAREVAHGAAGDLFASPLGEPRSAEAVRPGPGENGTEAQGQEPAAPGVATSAEEPGPTQGGLNLAEDQPHLEPPFFSALTRAVEAIPQPKAPGAQWANLIRNLSQKGVKQDEIDWSGVQDWLKDHPGLVTKDQVLEQLRANEVHVQEVHRGTPTEPPEIATTRERFQQLQDKLNTPEGLTPEEDAESRELLDKLQGLPNPWLDSSREARYAGYALPGGENYREMLLTLPHEPVAADLGDIAQRLFQRDYGELSGPQKAEVNNEWTRLDRNQTYRTPHWSEPNVLAHVRMDDRTDPDGRKVLHVAEIQSDWHQQGRRQGYQPHDLAALEARRREIEGLGGDATPEQKQEWADIMNRLRPDDRDVEGASKFRGVPDAPLKTQWPELAMKRVLRYAAENGYDRVSWDTGQTQADRYDLSKHVDRISYAKDGEGTWSVSARKDNRELMGRNGQTPDQISELLGKDIADKIASGTGHEVGAPDGSGELRGLDLRVGGEGMRGFYDKILPAFVNKYAKKWGAKVEPGEIQTGNAYKGPGVDQPDQFAPVHVVDITPAMRDSVMRGQPLWEGETGTPGAGRDLLADYHQFAAGREPSHELSRDYVLDRGQANGNEHLALNDPHGILAASTSDLPNAVRFDEAGLNDRMMDPDSQLVIHHNHPVNRSLSKADIGQLAYPGVHSVVAHAHDGSLYSASLTQAGRDWIHRVDPALSSGVLRTAYRTAMEDLRPALQDGIDRGHVSADRASSLLTDMSNRALDAAGLVDYVSPHTGDPIPDGGRHLINQAAQAVSASLNRFGFKLPEGDDIANRIDRSTRRVQPDEGMAGLPRAAGNDAQERGGLGSDRGREAGDIATGAGQGLAEESHEFTDREIEDRIKAPGGGEPPRPPGGPPGGDPPAEPDRRKADLDRIMHTDNRGWLDHLREAVAQFKENGLTGLKQYWFDQFAALEKQERNAYGGNLLPGRLSPTMSTRFARNWHSTLDVALTHSQIAYDRDKGVIVPIEGSKPLRQITGQLSADQKENGRPTTDDYALWSIVTRAKRLMSEGREHNVPPGMIERYENLDQLYQRPDGSNLFHDVHAEMQEWHNRLLDLGEATGIVNSDSRKLWEHDDYVPFYRALEDEKNPGPSSGGKGVVNVRSPIKQLTGGEAKINNIYENTVLNAAAMIKRSMANVAAQKARTMLLLNTDALTPMSREARVPYGDPVVQKAIRDAGLDPQRLTDAAKDGARDLFGALKNRDPDVISVMDNGRANYYRVNDPMLLQSLTAAGPTSMHGLGALLSAPARLLRGAVVFDPAFMLAHNLRMAQHAYILTGASPIASMGEALRQAKGLDPAALRLMAAGAMSGRYDIELPQHIRTEIASPEYQQSLLNTPIKVAHFVRDISESAMQAADIGPRIAVYKRALAKGASEAEALDQARDLLDFSTHGSGGAATFLAQTIPFLNARWQGMARSYRGFMGTDRTGIVMRGALVTAATLALWAQNKDDPEYQRKEDWDRQYAWQFKVGGQWFRLPKPFELGALFGSMPEIIADYLDNGSMRQAQNATGSLFSNVFKFNPIPVAIRPGLEALWNHDTFTGQPIINEHEQALEPDLQYGPNDSASVVAATHAFNAVSPHQVAPATVQHLIQGYLAGWGAYITEASDYLGEKAGLLPSHAAPSQMPVVGRFLHSEPEAGNRIQTDFFDLKQRITAVGASIKQAEATQDTTLAAKLRADHPEFSPAIEKDMTKLGSQLSKIRGVYQHAAMNPNLSADQKTTARDTYYKQRDQILDTIKPLLRQAEGLPAQP